MNSTSQYLLLGVVISSAVWICVIVAGFRRDDMFVQLLPTWKKGAPGGKQEFSRSREVPLRDDTHTNDTKMKSTPNATRVLLMANMRTGSSFVGELFGRNADVFYLFEPGLSLQHRAEKFQFGQRILTDAYLYMLRKLFLCDFNDLDFYFQWLSRSDTTKLAPRLHDLCGKECNISQARELCRRSKLIVIKSIRVADISLLHPMAEDSTINLKVIHLTRDPRPMIASRVASTGNTIYTATNKILPKKAVDFLSIYCKYNWQNLEVGTRSPYLQQKYLFLRYEDAAIDPNSTAVRLYTFLDQYEVPESVSVWVNINTKTNKGGFYSTSRNSSEAYQAWRLRMPYIVAKAIEEVGQCSQMMTRMGYYVLESEEQLRNLSRSLMDHSIRLPSETDKYFSLWF